MNEAQLISTKKLTKEKWLNLFQRTFRYGGRTVKWLFASRKTKHDGARTADAVLIVPILIDGVAEGMPVRLAPLPFPILKRTIRLVCRRDDLGDIPQRIAVATQQILRQTFERHFPDISDQVIYHDLANQLH